MSVFSTPEKLLVTAPSRIHFGLFSIGNQCEREFGGVGLMLQSPRTEISLRASRQLKIEANDKEIESKICEVVQRWYRSMGQFVNPAEQGRCEIKMLAAPPAHVGLGSGTQLVMAVAKGLCAFHGLPSPSVEELILTTKRAMRSAIGSHGFQQGGLLVDRGRAPAEAFAPLDFQDRFPDWPVVLAIANRESRVFGAAEAAAFKQLPASQPSHREQLVGLVRDRMLPALLKGNYATFADSVYQLGQGSGRLFESIQGGIYNGSEAARLVDEIRGLGIPAVGQSSWGPCIFSITPDIDTATRLVQALKLAHPSYQILQTQADNCGARVINQ